MGSCNFKKEKNTSDPNSAAISKNLFNLNYIIGKGGFGKVINIIILILIIKKDFFVFIINFRFGR